MFDRLKLIKETYEKMQEKLLSGISDIKEITKLMKESKGLEETVATYDLYLKTESQIKDLDELFEIEEDATMLEVAKEEYKSLQLKLEDLEAKLKILLLPKDPNDDKNVIMEIKGAAGGDEGNIFAGDLFRMYSKYA